MAQNLRKAFLELFVQTIFENIHPHQKNRIKEKVKQILEKKPESKIPMQFQRIHPYTKDSKIKEIDEKSKPLPMLHAPPRRPLPQTPQKPQKPLPLIQQQPQFNTQSPNIISLNKIEGFITDPSIQSIECAGPKKQITFVRSGVIQTTPITFNEKEIAQIMKEVSEKTKIPLISGVFKAALGNIIMTAVISEFVGTRFIIQKKIKARTNYPAIHKY